jgi:hypothetical protein
MNVNWINENIDEKKETAIDTEPISVLMNKIISDIVKSITSEILDEKQDNKDVFTVKPKSIILNPNKINDYDIIIFPRLDSELEFTESQFSIEFKKKLFMNKPSDNDDKYESFFVNNNANISSKMGELVIDSNYPKMLTISEIRDYHEFQYADFNYMRIYCYWNYNKLIRLKKGFAFRHEFNLYKPILYTFFKHLSILAAEYTNITYSQEINYYLSKPLLISPIYIFNNIDAISSMGRDLAIDFEFVNDSEIFTVVIFDGILIIIFTRSHATGTLMLALQDKRLFFKGVRNDLKVLSENKLTLKAKVYDFNIYAFLIKARSLRNNHVLCKSMETFGNLFLGRAKHKYMFHRNKPDYVKLFDPNCSALEHIIYDPIVIFGMMSIFKHDLVQISESKNVDGLDEIMGCFYAGRDTFLGCKDGHVYTECNIIKHLHVNAIVSKKMVKSTFKIVHLKDGLGCDSFSTDFFKQLVYLGSFKDKQTLYGLIYIYKNYWEHNFYKSDFTYKEFKHLLD